jgi:flagellar hook assembly protein FlgD
VTLRIFDVRGQLVRTLLENEPVSGERLVRWDGADGSGNPVPSGIYFRELRSGDVASARKMIVLR